MTRSQGLRGSGPWGSFTTDNLTIEGANGYSFYQDNPPALGSGTYAESFPIRNLGVAGLMKIVQLSGRVDFPASAGENARIRLYRYRKTAPAGAFTYTQATTLFDIDDTFPWSWTLDESDKILKLYAGPGD